MKTLRPLYLLSLSASVLLAFPSHLPALDEKAAVKMTFEIPPLPEVMKFNEIDGVFIKGGALYRLEGGISKPIALSGSLRYGTDYDIQPNGQVLRSTAAVWQLAEGQLLFSDGSVILSDGSMSQVGDHFVQQAGKLLKVSQGKLTEVPVGYQFQNGIVNKGYGRMLMPNGYVSVLQDGQMLTSSGEELSAWDTIQFQNGSVTLFKDGSWLSLAPGRLMVMNDGTKVWGNGTLSRRTRESNWDEVKFQLPEGVVIRIPRIAGASNQRRLKHGY